MICLTEYLCSPLLNLPSISALVQTALFQMTIKTCVKCPNSHATRRFRACSLLKLKADLRKMKSALEKVDLTIVSLLRQFRNWSLICLLFLFVCFGGVFFSFFFRGGLSFLFYLPLPITFYDFTLMQYVLQYFSKL